MKKRVKIKGKLSGYFNAPLRLGLFMVLANILIYFISWPAGIVLTVFLVIYFAVTVSQLLNSRVLLLNEMVSFATEYGQVQKKLLKELDLPYAILGSTRHLTGLFTGRRSCANRSVRFSRPSRRIPFPRRTRT